MQATVGATGAGLLSFAAVMRPCGWAPAAAQLMVSLPTADVGVHWTLTSRWAACVWGPPLCSHTDRRAGPLPRGGGRGPAGTGGPAPGLNLRGSRGSPPGRFRAGRGRLRSPRLQTRG
ncbi:ChbG/HpnK family deacetylase [Deinococcus aerolatus]|uniref:ChbG/HpnK family deacetylase n=1 Tax=Deinococcus aerolatus TaxID=522487 RepID=UPI00357153B3